MLIPVLLSGGCGTRLWPLSRQDRPKQFLPLLGQESLFQITANRFQAETKPLIICNQEHRFIVAEQLREIEQSSSGIILEPEGRNTTAAITVACLHAMTIDADPLILSLPTDHLLEDANQFQQSIEQGIAYAQKGHFVLFGVPPTHPHTGFGYVKIKGKKPPAAVQDFKEKPSKKTAEQYLKQGNYFWNSGIFLFKASVMLSALEKLAPDILACCKNAFKNAYSDLDFIRLDHVFSQCRNVPIDTEIMEHSSNLTLVPMRSGWDDLGSWQSLWEAQKKDQQDNVIKGDIVALKTTGCYLHSEHKLVTTLGVSDLVVVDTPDSLLIASRSECEGMKIITEQLRKTNREEMKHHRQVYRPWGSYDNIDRGARFQVKHIIVNPGGKLSVQMHHHRTEHWVIVSGTAKVMRGEETFYLSENQSTFIPVCMVHSLENPGKIPLELIEVQSGSYLEEDDIIRLKDQYGRCKKTNPML
ncbi:mannose-1-phosphate guanylyltransferase/mannose-6-phosphate isomerase [Algicola sagamiensis]|uniref:mannose-1-phosphate guanylyltransferase/mannose-6-phosphate isomerase n=1 Tax=Algicola sagamiensis TaxID=163869 RepID=UPI000364D14A|nr:mannose-1-phosphate guanylyltransferase/mannose-6-phosphate isomerase [Algicola sagamiensis]